MDPEQIRSEMSRTRASIDRKLDVLATYTAQAKEKAVRRMLVAIVATVAAMVGVWWWRRQTA